MAVKKCTALFIVFALIIFSQPNYISCDEVTSSGPARFGFLSACSDFSTYFGGLGLEQSTRITTDSEDNIILKFMSDSEDLPTSDTSFQPDFAGGIDDGFIAKFSPQGELIFSSYLGGSGDDHIVRAVTDEANNIYIVGSTLSDDFPVTDDAFQSESQGAEDGFITKISPAGTLLYSSYFGGNGVDRVQHVMFHEEGSVFLEGYSSSEGLATDGAYQGACSGAVDSFVAKLNSNLSEILMFTYFGGSGVDYGWRVDVDSEYNFIICGETRSANQPTTPDAICRTYSGDTDGFFAKISANGKQLLYATYIGGTSVDFGGGVDVDSSDYFYITGVVSSGVTNLEGTEDLYHGGMDFFAAKFTKDCELIFFRIIGGNRTDLMWDAVLDNDESIVIVGTTFSDDYPVINAVQQERRGGNDACVTVLSSDGESITLSTFIGGVSNEKGEGITIQSDGSLIVSGYTASSDFPVDPDAYQVNRTGSNDAFLYQINPTGIMPTQTTPAETSQITQEDYAIQVGIMSVGVIAVLVFVWIIMKRK